MKHIVRPMGLLDISGGSRLDLINRMSTNQVSLLKAGQGAATVLTTDIGRIIDRIIVYADESSAIAMTGEGNGDNIGRYLMRFVFFNDDFAIRPITDRSAIFVYGADALEKLSTIINVGKQLAASSSANQTQQAASLPQQIHSWIKAKISGIDVSLHATDPLEGAGFVLLVPADNEQAILAELESNGSQPLTNEQFDAMRIDGILPRLRHELTGDYIPLETGLWDDVSFNKGCYTGQEIIARLDSRGKVARRLVQIDLEDGEPIPVGTPITANGKPAGTITTSAPFRALGYVKSSVLEKENELMAADRPIFPVFEPQK